MNTFRYYVNLYISFVKNTFTRETDYRANFIADLVDSIANFMVSIIFFDAIYLNVTTIAGWSRWETLLLVGTAQLITANIYMFFMNNLPRIQSYVIKGDFDYITLKPCDEQFYVSCRYFYFGSVTSVLLSIILIVYSLNKLSISITIFKVFGYILFIISGICICYSIWLMIMVSSIIFLKIGELHELFLSMLKFMEYPASIYKNISRYIFMYIIPFITISNVPVEYITSKVTFEKSLYSIVVASIFFILSRILWKGSLRWYQSASS